MLTMLLCQASLVSDVQLDGVLHFSTQGGHSGVVGIDFEAPKRKTSSIGGSSNHVHYLEHMERKESANLRQ